jgi:hypothetical protein
VLGEGPEVDSSTEAICRLVDDYDLAIFLAEANNDAWISHDQLTALRRPDAALMRYATNGEDADDAARIHSPECQKIRALARATLETLATPEASA